MKISNVFTKFKTNKNSGNCKRCIKLHFFNYINLCLQNRFSYLVVTGSPQNKVNQIYLWFLKLASMQIFVSIHFLIKHFESSNIVKDFFFFLLTKKSLIFEIEKDLNKLVKIVILL